MRLAQHRQLFGARGRGFGQRARAVGFQLCNLSLDLGDFGADAQFLGFKETQRVVGAPGRTVTPLAHHQIEQGIGHIRGLLPLAQTDAEHQSGRLQIGAPSLRGIDKPLHHDRVTQMVDAQRIAHRGVAAEQVVLIHQRQKRLAREKLLFDQPDPGFDRVGRAGTRRHRDLRCLDLDRGDGLINAVARHRHPER